MAFLFLSIINYIYNRFYISWRVSDLNAAMHVVEHSLYWYDELDFRTMPCRG
jgi:hypothetical protein